MTKITITTDSGKTVRIKADGHAGYAKHGEDIVCSAISVLMLTGDRALSKIANHDTTEISEGVIILDISSVENNKAETILETIRIGLEGIVTSYGQYISIEYQS